MRRVFMLLAAAMAAMMVIGVGTAFASHNPGHNPGGGGGGQLPEGCTFAPGAGGGTTTCVTKTVDQTTEFVVTDQTTEFVVTDQTTVFEVTDETTEFVVTDETAEFVERPTTGPCTVGKSGRVGTAEGVATDEVLVTITDEVLVTTVDEVLVTTTDEVLVTTTDEVLVTTETTTTKVFEGRGDTGTLVDTTSSTVETGREVVDTEVTREVVDTEITREVVDTEITREVVDTTFTPTGKCKNVSGPQPQARG